MLQQADVRKSAREGGFRIGWRAPTQADGGRQSSESTLNEWHDELFHWERRACSSAICYEERKVREQALRPQPSRVG